jgi:hypothetical protein
MENQKSSGLQHHALEHGGLQITVLVLLLTRRNSIAFASCVSEISQTDVQLSFLFGLLYEAVSIWPMQRRMIR